MPRATAITSGPSSTADPLEMPSGEATLDVMSLSLVMRSVICTRGTARGARTCGRPVGDDGHRMGGRLRIPE